MINATATAATATAAATAVAAASAVVLTPAGVCNQCAGGQTVRACLLVALRSWIGISM